MTRAYWTLLVAGTLTTLYGFGNVTFGNPYRENPTVVESEEARTFLTDLQSDRSAIGRGKLSHLEGSEFNIVLPSDDGLYEGAIDEKEKKIEELEKSPEVIEYNSWNGNMAYLFFGGAVAMFVGLMGCKLSFAQNWEERYLRQQLEHGNTHKS